MHLNVFMGVLFIDVHKKARWWGGRDGGASGSVRGGQDAVWVSMMWFGVQVDLFYAIPIIANWTIEDSVREILLEVNHQISGRYPPAPGILE
jgi:hypothetical protein